MYLLSRYVVDIIYLLSRLPSLRMFHQTRADPGLGATPTPAPSKMVRPPPASLANRSSSLVSRDRMPCCDWSPGVQEHDAGPGDVRLAPDDGEDQDLGIENEDEDIMIYRY